MEKVVEDVKELEKDIQDIKCNPIIKFFNDLLKCFKDCFKCVFN